MRKTVLVFAMAVLLSSCDVQDVKDKVETTNQKVHVIVTDPNGAVQQTADAVETGIGVATPVVGVLPIPTPWKEGLLGVLAIAGAAAGAVQKWKRNGTERALNQVVTTVERAKKLGAMPEGFKGLAVSIQSTETEAKVKKIRDAL